MYREKIEQFKKLELVGTKDVARLLGWDEHKTSIYNRRGNLPAPIGSISGRPVWLRQQIEDYKKEKGMD